MSRLAALLAVLLTALGTARIVSSYSIYNHTIDEPMHLAAGMEWIEAGQYTYEDLHPPLARVFAALGPHLAGFHITGSAGGWSQGFSLLGRGEHYHRVLTLGRLGILPFFWLGSAVVFLWAWRAGGAMAAVLSTCLYTTTPPILAHSGLMTTDMALAACLSAAVLASIWWAEKPVVSRSLTFGFLLALALLSKFSTLLFLPIAWLLMTLAYAVKERGAWRRLGLQARARLVPASVALGVAAILVWSGYRFTWGPVEWLHLSLPAPAFFSGILTAWRRSQDINFTYVLGHKFAGAVWYFFPVVLTFKTPLALLILTGLAIRAAFRSRDRFSLALPLLFAAAVLLGSLMSQIQLGVRHILPIYTGLAVAAGVASARMLKGWGYVAISGLILWHITSGAMHGRDLIPYTNELAGDYPEDILVDSDVDWGQDMMRLGTRLHQLGAKSVTFQVFNKGYLVAGDPFPEVKDLPPGDTPPPGWTAVSVTWWKLIGTPGWADRIDPNERIGSSILLYSRGPR